MKLASFQYGLDTAVVSNVLWRLAHGYDSVSALTGFSHLADHPSLLLLLLVPLGRISGPYLVQCLFVLQALSVAMVSWFLWRFARAKGLGWWMSGVVYAVTLLGAGSWFAATGEFHILDLALGPLAAAVTNWELGHRRRAMVWAAVAAGARIEVALVVIILGLILPSGQSRREGLSLSVIGAGVGMLLVLIGALSGQGGTSVAAHLGHLGTSPGEVVRTALRHPLTLLVPLRERVMWVSVLFWTLTFGVLPLVVGFRWLLPATPVIVIPIFGSWTPADWYFEHYWHILLVFGGLALVEGLSRLKLPPGAALMLLAVPSVLVWATLGPLNPSLPRDWRIAVDKGRPDLVGAMEAISSADYVVVPLGLASNVSLRPAVAFFPRPYSCTGVETQLPAVRAYRELGPPEFVVSTSGRPDSDDPVWAALKMAYVRSGGSGQYVVWRLRDPDVATRLMTDCQTSRTGDTNRLASG